MHSNIDGRAVAKSQAILTGQSDDPGAEIQRGIGHEPCDGAFPEVSCQFGWSGAAHLSLAQARLLLGVGGLDRTHERQMACRCGLESVHQMRG